MPAPQITLRHIRVFLEIVRHGSLVKASQSLHITQSAVSKSLKEVETELGSVLIKRGPKGIVLTTLGEAFHIHATQALLSYSKAIDLAEDGESDRETLRIGALPTAAGSIIPKVVSLLAQPADRLLIQVESGSYDYLVQQMRAGQLDLIIGRMISRDNVGLSFESLYDEDIAIVVRAGHPLCQTPPSLETTLNYPLLVPPVGSLVRGAVDNYLFANGLKSPLQSVESWSESFSRTYVLDNDAVWFVPHGVAQTDLNNRNLHRLPFFSAILKAPIGLTTQTLTPLSPAATQFIERLRQVSQLIGTINLTGKISSIAL